MESSNPSLGKNLVCSVCGKQSLTEQSNERHKKICKPIPNCLIKWIHIPNLKETDRVISKEKIIELLSNSRLSWKSGPVSFQVRRENLYQDSLDNLRTLSNNQWFKEFNINFVNEAGDDAGGLTKEWLDLIIKEFFLRYFTRTQTEEEFYTIPVLVPKDQYEKYNIFGKLLGKLLIEMQNCHCRLHEVILKQLLSQPVEYEDLKNFDRTLFGSFKEMEAYENQDLRDFMLGNFCIEREVAGQPCSFELKPGGKDIEVTGENILEFIKLSALFEMVTGIEGPMNELKKGFFAIAGPVSNGGISVKDLFQLINGAEFVDVDQLQTFTEYKLEYHANHPIIIMFWRIIRSWPQEKLKKLLKFVIGSPCPPLQGFGELKTLRGEKCRFCISPIAGQGYPRGHTCFNKLDLPQYETEEKMNEGLDFIISHDFSFEIS